MDINASTARDLPSTLPDELLAEIFVHLHSCRLTDGEREGLAYLPVPPWAVVSHVSSRWRHISLKCKKLWSFIVDGDRRWTEASVKRSDPLPITMRAEIYPQTPHDSIVALVDLVPPARLASAQLWVNGSCPTDEETEPYTFWLLKLTQTPTPLLTYFEIAVSYGNAGGPSDGSTDIHLCLPWKYLGKHEQSPLRSIVLSECIFMTLFSFNGSTNLTSFKLFRCIYALDDNDDILGHDLILGALSASPNLEELVLSSSISPRGPILGSSFDKHGIKLPCLRILVLSDFLPMALDFLSYISIPSSATTSLTLVWDELEATPEVQFATLQGFNLERFLLNPMPSSHCELHILKSRFDGPSSGTQGVDISLGNGIKPHTAQETSFTIQITQESTTIPPSGPFLDAVLNLFSSRSTPVHTLVIAVPIAYFDCVRIGETWNKIEQVTVEGTAAALAFFDAWHRDAPHLLPNVTTLTISRVDLTGGALFEKLVLAITRRQLTTFSCARLAHVILDTPLVSARTIEVLTRILTIEKPHAVCVRRDTYDADVEALRHGRPRVTV
ncbi:unnamed protein product [Peniophora sp. CBMAI 1063]|nr:unnamed protein product [Peniophora sp. CBMAI 1063]